MVPAERYVAGLTSVRGHGPDPHRWLEWIEQFTGATGRACVDARQFVRSVEDVELQWRHRLDRSGPAAPRSWDAVNQAVLRLEQAGVVRQVTIGRRNRAYEIVGLFEAMTAYERILASPAADTAVAAPVRPVPVRPPRLTSGRNKSGPGADGTPIFEAKAHLRAFPSGSCDM